MADMDESLLQVLRLIKGKELIYGKNTGHEGVLLRYTKEIGLDPSFADPALGQISCLVVHGGIKGCEKFALYTFFKGSFLSGFSVLLEHKSRRREMALYVVPKALESMYKRLFFSKKILKIEKELNIFIFSVSLGYILEQFKKNPNNINSAVRGLLSFFLI
ncbi:hypothetical protein HDU92_004977 [Lobulomyces angularis]|nr:hypothetical protein HDU92_004977 [Lobulomyces angularis]